MGVNLINSRRLRISSIPRLDAPSISSTSRFLLSVISLQTVQSLQGWPFLESEQFNPLAKIRAVVVFPTPRGPVNI